MYQSPLSDSDLLRWLLETDEARLAELWHIADQTRRAHVGDAVHLRGLVEISNYCVRQCGYCGLRAGRPGLTRYRMSADEIMDCARQAVGFGYGTLVMQAGEDEGLTRDWMAALIRRIKSETPLAVTLSLGERSAADLAAWRAAGADRYLLRFETSDANLYKQIHPPRGKKNGECGMGNAEYQGEKEECRIPNSEFRIHHLPRIALLRRLRALGFEIGSGVMIGIPGQSFASLARDIELFRELDLDMIGVGPFIPHPETPLGRGETATPGNPSSDDPAFAQVPATELMTYKVVALTRLACPQANIPSTTALATINRTQGRELGLARGANVVMPNLTPARYRELYAIYPGKACINETAGQCAGCLAGRILALGRTEGRGPGSRRLK